MITTTNEDERMRLRQALDDIAATHQTPENGGAILSSRSGFLSGSTYCFSGDIERAFRFQSETQALKVTMAFPALLGDCVVVPMKLGSRAESWRLLELLVEIKALWDEAGLGEDAARSEDVYGRLMRTIAELSGDVGRIA